MRFVSDVLVLAMSTLVVGSDGKDPEIWERGPSVIYAEVTAVQKEPHGSYLVRLLPIATLTGKYDAAFDGEVTVAVSVTPEIFPNASMINEVPKKGTKVLAYTAKPLKGSNTSSIMNGNVTFMPKDKGIIEVTGFDDPMVTETIASLRKLRGKQREATEKAASEKK